MKDGLELEVELRTPGSTNEAKRLRAAGKIPAVLYGGSGEPRTIAVSPRTVIEILRSDAGENSILNLSVADGPQQTALIHDYQVDPVTHRLLHADFKRIAMDVAVEVDVPIEVIGEARGVKVDKGILDQVVREVQVRCLPGEIPDEFQADVSDLDIGDSIHIRDLEVPEGVEILSDLDATVVHVTPPTAEEEIEEEEVDDLLGEMAEPEIVGAKGGDDDDEDDDS
jgi:large subunit ribosomal protein L25